MSFIELRGVNCKSSEGPALKNITFEIDEKGVYGFLGRSGSGKTLLCRVLAGVCAADGGSVIYKDNDLYKNPKQTAVMKRKIGYVPQKCFFDRDSTVFESLDLIGKAKLLDPDKRFRQIKDALELTGLSEKYEVLVSDLSLSEKKRLTVASALLGNPDLIIMDEPLQYMDKNQAEGIKSVIELLRKRKVILIFSSRAADVQSLSDNIAFLHNGELILWKNSEELVDILTENRLGTLADAYDALALD